jgi:hypothetical protein
MGSRLETLLTMYELIRSNFPRDYLARLKLRTPWFVGLTGNDPFPRLHVANRLFRDSGPLFGPFLTRDAARDYEQEVLALFQIRRCTEVLAPRPDHPGCIYGEMNQCLRPCQCAVSGEEYGTEAQRVSEFLSTNGRSAIATLTAARDRAAEETDFEHAALIHERIEKMKAAAGSRHEVVSEVHGFSGVALTRSAERGKFCLWPLIDGIWQNALVLDFPDEESHSKSLDHDLRETLASELSNTQVEGKRIDHLALFSRWYYSSWRDGEWFPFRALANLSYRKLVRSISNLAKPKCSIRRP